MTRLELARTRMRAAQMGTFGTAPASTDLDPITEASVAAGLTSDAAAQRLAQYGPTDPSPRKRRSALADFLRLFSNPLALVLLIAATASAALGPPLRRA